MRIAIIADIHGNQLAFEAVLADLAQQPPVDQIVIAGDLCLNGPRPRQVLDMIQGLRCPVIQGNVDVDVVRQGGKSERKRSIVAWTREQIGAEGIAYLAALPFSYRVTNPDGGDLLVVHANPLNLDDAIMPTATDDELERLLGGLDTSVGVLTFGHLHIAYMRRWRHLLLVDAGSCGLPRDGDTRASYAIVSSQGQGWSAEHRRVPYNLKEVVKQLRNSGMPGVEKRIKILTEAKY
jgi:predicted phosphodiesterase